MGPEEALKEVLDAPIGAHLTRPDTQIVDRDGWYRIITPSNHSASVNEVVRARIASNEIDSTIDRILAESAGRPFKWVVGPDSEPADAIAIALRARGLTETFARGMVAELSLDVSPPASIEARPVGDDLIAYSEVVGKGWGIDPAEYRADFERAMRERPFKPHLFLALDAGVPIGCAAFVEKKRSAYFTSAVVLPEHRGKGAYRALIAARLERTRALGLPIATTQAREATSAPMLEHLGWKTVCRFSVFAT